MAIVWKDSHQFAETGKQVRASDVHDDMRTPEAPRPRGPEVALVCPPGGLKFNPKYTQSTQSTLDSR